MLASLMLYAWLALPPTPTWAKGLTAPQRQQVMEAGAEDFCACHSALTLAGCLQTRPGCALASQVATVLARGVVAGAPLASLRAVLAGQIMAPLCAPPHSLAIPAGAPRLGPAEAPIQVVEFADFRCSHCRTAAPEVHRAIAALGTQASLVYLPISLQGHPAALEAAEAALAAQAQGKFWPMHAALFAAAADGDEAALAPAGLLACARQARLDIPRFRREMAAHVHRGLQQAMQAAATAVALQGTPALFVNGRHFAWQPELISLAERLQMEGGRDAAACQ